MLSHCLTNSSVKLKAHLANCIKWILIVTLRCTVVWSQQGHFLFESQLVHFLCVLLVHAKVLSGDSSFFPLSRNVYVRLIGDSKFTLKVCVCVCVRVCVCVYGHFSLCWPCDGVFLLIGFIYKVYIGYDFF